MSIISNFDIYNIFKKLKLQVACCCRDELMKYKTHTAFIINYSYSFDGTNGSHWVALYLNPVNKKAYYSDSFGRQPIKEVLAFCKKLKYEEINYNNIDLQSIKSFDCGWFAVAFIVRMTEEDEKDISEYVDMFSTDKFENDKILIRYFQNLIK